MEQKFIKNIGANRGVFEKLSAWIFSEDLIQGVELTPNGFTLVEEKKGHIEIPFSKLAAIKTHNYLERIKVSAMQIMTFVTTEGKTYSLHVTPYNGDVEAILNHFTAYQMPEGIPEKVEHIQLQLTYDGINKRNIRLEHGTIIFPTKKGDDKLLSFKDLISYEYDYGLQLIILHFGINGKVHSIKFSARDATNVRLIKTILESFSIKKKSLF